VRVQLPLVRAPAPAQQHHLAVLGGPGALVVGQVRVLRLQQPHDDAVRLREQRQVRDRARRQEPWRASFRLTTDRMRRLSILASGKMFRISATLGSRIARNL
jgi:hypothetical protein